MPQSDTWPGGTGLEMMNSMDSAGSCDSVLSANSGFSDDSLEYLSAEEKACLMFLEETIESLDIEEDSGLSNDEPDQLPSPGNLATKLADLSASMSKGNLNGLQEYDSRKLLKENVDTKPMYSYLVPTPFVVANTAPCSVPSAKILQSKPPFTSKNNKLGHKHNQKPAAPPVPLEDNVISPSTKSRDYSGRTPEGALPRGPLSYDALVHLRRSASAKKTPLCPTIDHTIDLDKRLPSPVEGPNLGNLPRSEKSYTEVSKGKTGPPAVAPKPKFVPSQISVKTQNGSVPPDSSYNVKQAKDPQLVRLEALQKLGLLKDEEPENDAVAPLSLPKSHSSLDQTPNIFKRGPSNSNPSRSPSFSHSQVPTEPKNRTLQSSASFHHYSRRDKQPMSASQPAQSEELKKAGMERSATLDDHRSSGNCPEPQRITSAKPVKTSTTAQPVAPKPSNSQPVCQTPSNSVGYTVMVVPGMGADRKEALRKLGLLKD